MRSEKEFQEIEEAKEFLKSKGFYVDNLWQVDDVKARFKCEDDDAQEVLDEALQNEATMDQIWFAIDFHAQEMGLEEIEDED